MKIALVLLGLFVATQAHMDAGRINMDTCGRRPAGAPERVVGGMTTQVGDHNWLVGFYYLGSFRCGGSLITNQWVLTAAHCFPSITGTANIVFYVGAHSRTGTEAWVVRPTVNLAVRHPSYNSANFRNDIGLYRLSVAVAFNENVGTVCIPDGSVSYVNVFCWAAGWGTMSNGQLATVKQHVNLKIVEAECVAYYGTQYDPVTMICAGIVGDGKDTCQGDSGGPYTVKQADGRYYKVGITSWGRGCGDIGVCARTSTYYAWIQQVLAANP